MYIVLEVQSNLDNTVGMITNSYTDINIAENKYHTILAAAAISSIYRHGAFMLNDEGLRLKSDFYIHEPTIEEEE